MSAASAQGTAGAQKRAFGAIASATAARNSVLVI
jgi:hypothetical protein